MRKVLTLIFVCCLVICGTHSHALCDEVVVLAAPADEEAMVESGNTDDMQLGEPVDMGDRIFTLQAYKNKDEFRSNYYRYHTSGADAEYLVLWIDIQNFSQTKQIFLKDAEVVVTYESSRGTYQFGGDVYQCQQSGDAVYRYEKDDFTGIDPLYNGYYFAACLVPNFVIDNPGELKMEIKTGKTTLTYYIRR